MGRLFLFEQVQFWGHKNNKIENILLPPEWIVMTIFQNYKITFDWLNQILQNQF